MVQVLLKMFRRLTPDKYVAVVICKGIQDKSKYWHVGVETQLVLIWLLGKLLRPSDLVDLNYY